MTKINSCLCLAFVVLASSPASAQEEFSVTGTAFFGSEDPEADMLGIQPEGEPQRLFFTIEGDAARALYEALAITTETEACIGGEMKQTDALECAVAGDFYTCDFGFNLDDGSLTGGGRTC